MSASPSSQNQTLFRAQLSVRWRDLDAFNHVNNAMFLSYIEEARLRWLLTIDGEWMHAHAAPVIASVQLDLKRPIGWPGEVLVELRCDRIGSSSLTIAHRLLSAGADGVLYADGHTVLVWMDPATGHSTPLPDAVRQHVNGTKPAKSVLP